MITDKEISEFNPHEEKILLVYTSQYRYSGPNRLDITAKKGNEFFRPTSSLVFDFKDNKIDKKEYEEIYRTMMRDSYINNRKEWKELLSRDSVVLVCFCRAGEFCHRLLLAKYLEKCGAEYLGEVPNV